MLWHSDEDGPKGDVEVGRVQKENMEAEKGEKLQLTSPLAIDPIGGHKEQEQAVRTSRPVGDITDKQWLMFLLRGK